MRHIRTLATLAIAALAVTLAPATLATAASPTTLVVHFRTPAPDVGSDVVAQALTGEPGTLTSTGADAFGTVWTFTFPDIGVDAYLGITNGEDSLYPTDKRYVRASGTTAEVWMIDGDTRAFAAPVPIAPADIEVRDSTPYMELHTLAGYVPGITFATGTNGYAWKGLATGSVPILTTYYQANWYEIAVARNEVMVNAAGTAIPTGTLARPWSYLNIDGFKGAGAYDYSMSLGWIERFFDLGTLITGTATGNDYALLTPVPVAYDRVMPAASPEAEGFDSAKLAQIDAQLDALVNTSFYGVNPGWSSLNIAITRNGKTVFEKAYGYSQQYATTNGGDARLLPRSQWTPATTDTIYDLASNTKMYATNYAIQKLVNEGQIDLSTHLVDMPGWSCFTDANTQYSGKWTLGGSGGLPATPINAKADVTLDLIIKHRAGFIPDPEYPNYTSAGPALWYQTDQHADRTDLIDTICKTPLRYQPDSGANYSDLDYIVLGVIIEQITGMSLDEYMQEAYYGPMGLTDTMFNPLDNGVSKDQCAATEINGNTRDGYVSFGTLPDSTPVNQRNYTLQCEVHDEKAWYSLDGVAGHAGLFSTVGDMASLTQVMLNGGIYNSNQFFTSEIRDDFTTRVGTTNYAKGWYIQPLAGTAGWSYFQSGAARGTYGHQGWTGTLTEIDPYNDMTVVTLTNRIHAPVYSSTSYNSFAIYDNPLASLQIQGAFAYYAYTGHEVSLNPIVSAATAAVDVPWATSSAAALAALPATVDITAADGHTYPVAVTWTLPSYDGSTAGTYAATGTFALPHGVHQSTPVTALTTTGTVTVGVEPLVLDAPLGASVVAGDTWHGTFTATGGSGAKTLALTGEVPQGVTLDPATGVVTFVTSEASVGTRTITVTATDAAGTSVSAEVKVQVVTTRADLGMPLFRFYKSDGTHFYTASSYEAALVKGYREYSYEGVAGFIAPASATPGADQVALHRFYKNDGTHFYTASDYEAQQVKTYPQYSYEGVVGYVSSVPADGLSPVHRFYKTAAGTHFYTASDHEASLVKTYAEYGFEGVAFYLVP